jgi:hypothetical protein
MEVCVVWESDEFGNLSSAFAPTDAEGAEVSPYR